MSKEYVLRRDGDDIVECTSCGSPAPTVEYSERFPKETNELLCMFCYETHFGSILKYRHNAEDQSIARALCQALNLIVAKLDTPPHAS